MLNQFTDYNLTKCLLWGVSVQHFLCFKEGFGEKKYANAFQHLFMGCIEAIPLVGQIISVAEMCFFNLKNKKVEVSTSLFFPGKASVNQKQTAIRQVKQQKKKKTTVLPGKLTEIAQQIVQASPKNFVGLASLKRKQQEHLCKLEMLANKGEWQHLQTHTSHIDSGFDWWMFPVNRASASYGDEYNIGLDDVETLKKDAEFMKNYRDGVVLVAKSWGWDLVGNTDISDTEKRWVNYSVRLGKMLQSLTLFKQKDLHDSLVHCVQKANIRHTLDSWILPYLASIPSDTHSS